MVTKRKADKDAPPKPRRKRYVVPKDPKRQTTFYCDELIVDLAQELAYKRRMTFSDFVTSLLKKELLDASEQGQEKTA
jgi:hypothetical protein